MRLITAYFILVAWATLTSALERGNPPISPPRTKDDDVSPIPMPKCSIYCIKKAVKITWMCSMHDVMCVCANMDYITGAAAGCIFRRCGFHKTLTEVKPAANEWCGHYMNV